MKRIEHYFQALRPEVVKLRNREIIFCNSLRKFRISQDEYPEMFEQNLLIDVSIAYQTQFGIFRRAMRQVPLSIQADAKISILAVDKRAHGGKSFRRVD